MPRVKLTDLPKLSPNEFSSENSCNCLHIPSPGSLVMGADEFVIRFEYPYRPVGWSDRLPERLMIGRKGWIAIMVFSKKSGEVWFHYPLDSEHKKRDCQLEYKLRRGRVSEGMKPWL